MESSRPFIAVEHVVRRPADSPLAVPPSIASPLALAFPLLPCRALCSGWT